MQRMKGGDTYGSSELFANKQLISATGCRLYDLIIFNKSGVDVLVQLFDSATEPDDGTIPKVMQICPTLGYISFFWTGGRPFANGVWAMRSSAYEFLTEEAGDELWFDWVLL